METLPSLSIGYYSIWYRALLENMIIHDVNLAWWSGPFDSDPDEKRMQKKIDSTEIIGSNQDTLTSYVPTVTKALLGP